MITNWIKTNRQALNLSQQAVATQLGISQSRFQQYESGKHQPSLEMLIDLAKLFNTSLTIGPNGVKFPTNASKLQLDVQKIREEFFEIGKHFITSDSEPLTVSKEQVVDSLKKYERVNAKMGHWFDFMGVAFHLDDFYDLLACTEDLEQLGHWIERTVKTYTANELDPFEVGCVADLYVECYYFNEAMEQSFQISLSKSSTNEATDYVVYKENDGIIEPYHCIGSIDRMSGVEVFKQFVQFIENYQ